MRGRKGNHALKKVMGFMIDYFVFKLKNFNSSVLGLDDCPTMIRHKLMFQ